MSFEEKIESYEKITKKLEKYDSPDFNLTKEFFKEMNFNFKEGCEIFYSSESGDKKNLKRAERKLDRAIRSAEKLESILSSQQKSFRKTVINSSKEKEKSTGQTF